MSAGTCSSSAAGSPGPGPRSTAASRDLRVACIERERHRGRDVEPLVAADPRRAPLPRAVPVRAGPRGARGAQPAPPPGAPPRPPGAAALPALRRPDHGPRRSTAPASPCTTCSARRRDGGRHRYLGVEAALEHTPVLRRDATARRLRLPRRGRGRRPVRARGGPHGARRRSDGRDPTARRTVPCGSGGRIAGVARPRRARRLRSRDPGAGGRRCDGRLVRPGRRRVPGRRGGDDGHPPQPRDASHRPPRPHPGGLRADDPGPRQGRVLRPVARPLAHRHDRPAVRRAARRRRADRRRRRRDPRRGEPDARCRPHPGRPRRHLRRAAAARRRRPVRRRLDRPRLARAPRPRRAGRPHPDRRRQVHDLPGHGPRRRRCRPRRRLRGGDPGRAGPGDRPRPAVADRGAADHRRRRAARRWTRSSTR